MDRDQLWAIGKKYNILQKKTEFMAFIDYISTKKLNNILEIGTNGGGATAIFCSIAQNVVSVDMAVHPLSRTLESEFPNFTRIVSKSDVAEIPSGKYDVIFIDGGHDLDTLVCDYTKYRKYLKQGGVIAIHDILFDGYFEAIGETCHVKKLWAIFRGNVAHSKEFIDIESPADSGYEPLNNPEDLSKWGGIGCLTN